MKDAVIGQFLLVLIAASSAAAQAVATSTHSNETDRLSLLEFKKAIVLDPQRALASWNESTHLCYWEGVSCRTRDLRRVVSLRLVNRGLVGHISPWLGNLTFLRNLALLKNTFTGEIPLSLGRLRRLQTVHLSNNILQGSIPTSLANCSSLKVLWLNNNGLDGQIPADLPPNLQQLQLSTNDIGGTIPPSIANVSAMRKLSCAFNRIQGSIPDELAQLGGLEILYLGSNLLVGMFPPAILNLSSLTGLGLNTNMLSGEVPSDIGNSLPNLQILSLGQNFFHGEIPHSFVNATSLRVLDISTNNFTGVVPSSIGRLSKLVKLNIETNKVQARNKQEWDFVSSLANCTELQGLSLAGVVPHWLGAFKNLQKLSLSTNMFTGNIPSSLSNLSQLIELLLDTNQFIGHIPTSLGNLQSLETLSISNNNLHGRVPERIFSIPTIREIGLSSNNLHGQLPAEVGNAKQLVILLLSANKLSGDIPSTVGACKSLEDIELDNNIFNGNMPASFGNLFGLKVLNLSYNNLTGSVPASLGNLQHLEQLDLSFNHLEGKVPVHGIFKNATATHIDGNQGLCGGASNLYLPSCSVMSSNISKYRLPVIFKVAIPLACMLSLLATVIFVLLWRRKKHMRSSMSSLSFDSKFPKVSYKDLARATDGFSVSNLIGTGRYSSVYRGKILQEENVVAVKVLCLETRGAQRSFIAECNALRNVRHRNLVRILTACSSIDSRGNDFKALLYEFMPGGDLHNLLYSTEGNGNSLKQSYISLAQRLNIVVDIADAMAYLHHNHHGSIVHCDLKPSNILLDNGMVAHVGDFGLARLQVYPMSSSFDGSTSVSSLAIRGTIGYVAPEYGAGGQVSTAADVYSFGVVLLEIFIRKSPTDDMFKDGLSIAKFAEVNFPDKMLQSVDPQLVQELDLCQEAPSAEDNGVHCLLSVLNVGLCCTKSSPSDRINMEEVAGRLHRIRDAYIGG
ncbi:receptor kinase-like protein Xa21 isoform X2 [Triticum dicoccoides]|uniref:receptor kinase-like protein Xa21 isoform X2 n=1 Tax=Triticum dicoccoides TaxID=85692 RepID=UPI000E7C2F80|nr:receptor kinase-like protein Xa21 isoform X2 [Triticum dicoccoides]